jgi:ABC-type Na+ efflux pump permease subunit
MPVATIAAKDLRLLLRDRRSAVILLAMPVIFIFVLGFALGETFGQKPDDRLRVTVLVEDRGLPAGAPLPPAGDSATPAANWSDVVLADLRQTAGIKIERLTDRATAERLVRSSERAAVIVIGAAFSERLANCSFLDDVEPRRPGLNPFYRNGVNLAALDIVVLADPTQQSAAAVIEQVAQVTLLRVVLPWMIGRAFDEVARQLPIAAPVLKRLFAKYDLTGKTWAKLTRSAREPNAGEPRDEPPVGVPLGRLRYQLLVPSYTVTFAFFLVLTAGSLFVSERRQGTLLRLRAAPLAGWQILAGKLLPCLAVSVVQGLFLLAAGRLVFGMSWGPHPAWLILVVVCTSVAATGLSLLVAGPARTEAQVAVYGSLLVLVLAAVSGSLMTRELMPEAMKTWSRLTPHAWALDAYNQLLVNPSPNLAIVGTACLVLLLFGTVTLAVGWWRIRLE